MPLLLQRKSALNLAIAVSIHKRGSLLVTLARVVCCDLGARRDRDLGVRRAL